MVPPIGAEQVLVVKRGGLEEFIQAMTAMAAIREANPLARITLLTSPPLEGLAKASPYFDAVETDLGGFIALAGRLRSSGFKRAFDLDGGGRSGQVRAALWPGPAWQRPPAVDPAEAGPPDLSWILKKTSLDRPSAGQRKPYVLLIPGGGGRREQDRWPAERFGEFGKIMYERGFDIVVGGHPKDAGLAREIQRRVSAARDLTGAGDHARTAALCARAALVVGGADEAMHLAAAVGAPTIVILPSSVDPEKAAPRGHVTIIQGEPLADLPPASVAQAANSLTEPPVRGA